ncbi:MAG: Rieske 2Fe-2S domain-containing protein [candidate division Zixibacteria bacterium]|nr:Rieske 2Fe-2S domain-containing protein [candidate division Zixibacteria bacterium]
MAENNDKKISRRTFLDYLIGGSVVVSFLAVLAGILTYIYPPKKEGGAEKAEKVEVGPLADLPVGKAKPVDFQGKNVMVMHVKAGLFAVDMRCTHLGCMVEWEEGSLTLKCPCHAAFFDYQGKVISGPAPKPLPLYKVEVANEIIYVTGLA